MSDNCCDDFQLAVGDFLIRHRSVIDILTKYQEATARVNRAFAKAVTECGCLEIKAGRQNLPAEVEYSELKQYMSSHLSGEPCEHCKEIISAELGHSLFYMTALCNLLGLNVHDIMRQECNTVTTLGIYHLS
ncbi:MAG: hypothetical protein H6Q73_2633 [Firmicutes bacterium]|nr:hypothetical protein [Bacillota bacterium]